MAELAPLQQQWQFNLETIDIDEDAQLRERYNTKVPVLAIDGEEVCQYFLDPDKLTVYFE
jgi:hypothetical protein